MTEATCQRELELEIPAEAVQKAVERVSREFARVARVPGFRPGKAPITLIRRKFAEDIKGEVLQMMGIVLHEFLEHIQVPSIEDCLKNVSFFESNIFFPLNVCCFLIEYIFHKNCKYNQQIQYIQVVDQVSDPY